jgi:hypothetical protein
VKHEEALALLPEFLQGRLAEPARSVVAGHRATCEECRALSEAYGVIAAALKPSEPPANARAAAERAHPESVRIIAYAVDPESLEPGASAAIAAHLSACQDCSREAEATRGAHEATRAKVFPFPGNLIRGTFGAGRANLRAGLAAAVVVILLAYPAFLGLGRLPRIEEEVEALRAARGAAERQIQELKSSLDDASERLRREPAWAGPVDLHVLEEPARGSGGIRSLRVAADQPFLLLSLLPPVPGRLPGDVVFRFAISDADDRIAWSADLAVSKIRRRLEYSGVLTFSIPTAGLPPGRYTMRVARAGGHGEDTVFQAAFEVVRQD